MLKTNLNEEKTMLDKAIQLACKVHYGQKDLAGEPYILHPLRVMMQMDTELEMVVAVLHDVIEDGGGIDFSLKRFPTKVVIAVHALSHHKEESYASYIKRVSKYELALKVKLADLDDNLDPKRTALLDPVKNAKRRVRYLQAQEFLQKTEWEKRVRV
jgi:(p)ppGpp synthase/HD superfamily hydrolase